MILHQAPLAGGGVMALEDDAEASGYGREAMRGKTPHASHERAGPGINA